MHTIPNLNLNTPNIAAEDSPLVATAEQLEGAGCALSFALEAESNCTRTLNDMLRMPNKDYLALSKVWVELDACMELVRRCVALVREVQTKLNTLLAAYANQARHPALPAPR